MKKTLYLSKSEVERFKSYESVKELRSWLLTKAGREEWFSEKSFYMYLTCVKSFMLFIGCQTADQVVEKLKGNLHLAVKLVKDWVQEFNCKGWSPSTKIQFVACLKRFLIVNEVEIDWKKITLPKKRRVVGDKAPNKHELRRILMYAPSWLKTTILVLATSGLRVGSLIRLNLKHVDLDYDKTERIALVEVPPEATKAKIGYYTFMGPEAVDSLKNHLATREKKGEELTEESPLIKPPISPRPTYQTIVHCYIRTLRKAGLTKKSSRYFVLHLHTLRKFFRTNLEAILTKSQIERLMGHVSTEYLDGSYFRPLEREMLENYRRALPNLTIIEDVQSEEYQKKQLLRLATVTPGITEEKLRKLKEILARAKTIDEGIAEFKRFQEKPKTKHKGNSKHMVVQGENALLHRLENGWRFVQSLNGDKYLLQHTQKVEFD